MLVITLIIIGLVGDAATAILQYYITDLLGSGTFIETLNRLRQGGEASLN